MCPKIENRPSDHTKVYMAIYTITTLHKHTNPDINRHTIRVKSDKEVEKPAADLHPLHIPQQFKISPLLNVLNLQNRT